MSAADMIDKMRRFYIKHRLERLPSGGAFMVTERQDALVDVQDVPGEEFDRLIRHVRAESIAAVRYPGSAWADLSDTQQQAALRDADIMDTGTLQDTPESDRAVVVTVTATQDGDLNLHGSGHRDAAEQCQALMLGIHMVCRKTIGRSPSHDTIRDLDAWAADTLADAAEEDPR